MMQKNKGTEVSIVNLSSYTSPKVTEVRNKDWVFYGDDNNYFQYLIDRYNGSPTNNAIINGISEMIYGKGLDATDSAKKPDQYAQAISLFQKDCVRKLAYDLKLMGQCAIQVIYSKDRTKIAQIEHMPVETLRAEKCNEDNLSKIEEEEAEYLLKSIKGIIKEDARYKKGKKTILESYNDYPESVSNNAKRGIELNKEVNNKCATEVGKIRAQQLAQKKNISLETIKRMYSYLSRAEEFYDEGDTKACGTISYLLWGGKSAKRWAESKLKELGEI